MLNWKIKADFATCFRVYHSPENHCYISHGEIDVAAISYNGVTLWNNSGADIFTIGFSVSQSEITAIDWNEDRYHWDNQTGKLLQTTANKAVNPRGGSSGF